MDTTKPEIGSATWHLNEAERLLEETSILAEAPHVFSEGQARLTLDRARLHMDLFHALRLP